MAQDDEAKRLAAALAGWGADLAPETCTRCGAEGHSHTHCSDGRVLCPACRPSTAQYAAEQCAEVDAGDRREAAEDAGEEPEEE